MTNTSLIRLLQLSSSVLPVGGFTYSQGLEYAVECGWVKSEQDLHDWLVDLIESNLQVLDIPVLVRLYQACQQHDHVKLDSCLQQLIAYRETSELRQEEQNRGRAMTKLLLDLDIELSKDWQQSLNKSQLAGMALAGQQWQIDIADLVQGYAWSWLENMVISGVKLIPLGQAAGQRILRDLADHLSQACEKGMQLSDDEIGSSTPALAYASAMHETQYTRLYRS
jgi:urease accessory protein